MPLVLPIEFKAFCSKELGVNGVGLMKPPTLANTAASKWMPSLSAELKMVTNP